MTYAVLVTDKTLPRYIHNDNWKKIKLIIGALTVVYTYDTIRYSRLTCAQKLTRWPA